MNNGKPIDEANPQPLAQASSVPAPGLAMPESPDLSRRRLIRGAAGIAPVVLTLRSGALAAASCTGAIGTDFSAAPGNGLLSGPNIAGVVDDPGHRQVCVTGAAACSGTSVKDHPSLNGGVSAGEVYASNGGFICSTDGTNPSLVNTSTNFAILSSGAYSSFIAS